MYCTCTGNFFLFFCAQIDTHLSHPCQDASGTQTRKYISTCIIRAYVHVHVCIRMYMCVPMYVHAYIRMCRMKRYVEGYSELPECISERSM